MGKERKGILSVIRIHYHFTGRVQGVGFRYTAYYSATRHGVTGFVKNEDDGSVTMEAQGTPEAIMAMMRQIKESRWIYIESSSPQRIPPDPEEREFRVRGY